jgi:zinc protease
MVTKYFGSIPRPARKLDKTWTEEPPQDGERLVTLRRVGDVSAVGVAYHIPAGSHDENAALEAGLVMGNYILGGGTLSSRLGVRVRQKEGLSYGITSGLSVSSQDQRASFTISAIVNPQNLPRLQACAMEELDRLLRDGVTADELNNARDGYLQALKVGRSSDSALAGSLGTLRHLDRTMLWEADLEKKIAALTPGQITAAMKRHLDPKKLVVVSAGDFGAAPEETKKPAIVQ